jgi:hypothetical protein
MYEIFDPRDGLPVYLVPSKWMARLFTWAVNRRGVRWLDYEMAGQGW